MNSKVFNFPMPKHHSLKSQKHEFWTNFVLQYLHWPSLAHYFFHNVKAIKVVFKPMQKILCASMGLESSSHLKSDLCSYLHNGSGLRSTIFI